MEDDPGIVKVPLAVGLTRPPLKLGVPYEALTINLMASGIALIVGQRLQWFGICLPIHAVCFLVCKKDPRSFELLALWCLTTLPTLVRTRWYWRAASYSPLTLAAPLGRFALWQLRMEQRLRRRLANHYGALT